MRAPSLAGIVPAPPFWGLYSASKHALEAFTEHLWRAGTEATWIPRLLTVPSEAQFEGVIRRIFHLNWRLGERARRRYNGRTLQ